jgi:ubiquinone biosynthesis accessory factor UbiJ
MLDPALSASINHLLRGNRWALERLRPFAGKTARFVCLPFSVDLTVSDNGEVAAATGQPATDVCITLTPGLMLRVLARDETAWTEIGIDGDTGFAAAINHVWRNLRWDAEEDLSRVFGDIAAHRMVQTGMALERWGRHSADNLARSLAEYWTEEQPLIAGKHDIARFNRDVDALRDDIARLEKRLERISAAGKTDHA